MIGSNNWRLDVREWTTGKFPESVNSIASTLNPNECKLLHFLAHSVYTGEGEIVDVGCWLGASTLTLGLGLQANGQVANKEGRIKVFDSFIPDEQMKHDTSLAHWLADITDHATFRAAFDRNVSSIAPYLEVFDGDVTHQRWPHITPIEILIVDGSKTIEIDDWQRRNLYSCLRPGSIVVHQGFFDPWSAWIPLSMAHLRDYFRIVGTAEWSTCIFACTKQIPYFQLRVSPTKYYSISEALRILDETYFRRLMYAEEAITHLQRAVLANIYGDKDLARAITDVALKTFPDVPRLHWAAKEFRANTLDRI